MADTPDHTEAVRSLLDLLTEFRATSGVGTRTRLAVQATRAFAMLRPDERRQLAIDVAQLSAPHLVERIEGETELDLTPAQVRAVIEMVGRMGRDDLLALRTSVEDPDWQRRAAQRAAGAADSALDDAGIDMGDASLADVLPPPPSDEVGEADEVAEVEEVEEVEVTTIDDPFDPEPPLDEPPDPSVERRGSIRPVEPPDGPRDPPVPLVTPASFDAYETGLPDMVEWRATGVSDDDLQFRGVEDRRRDPVTSAERSARAVERSWFGEVSLDVEPVAVRQSDLGERLRSVERSSQQLRQLLAAADEFGALAPGEQAGVLRAVRATWVRRRAVLALLASGHVTAESARAVVGSFDSPTNRAWIVASLVEAGIGDVAQWADMLSPAAVARLERRYAA